MIISNYFLKSEILGVTGFSNHSDKTTTNLLLDNAFFNVTAPGYFNLYDKILVSVAPRCRFYSITGSSNLSIYKDITNMYIRY